MGSTLSFDSYIFQCNLANSQVYTVTYVDYPDGALKGWHIEDFFDQSIKSIAAELDDFKINKRVVNENPKYEISITYKLYAPKSGKIMTAKLLKHGKRTYYITFVSNKQQSEQRINSFINSFKIIRTTKN